MPTALPACEFEGDPTASVSEKVSFLVEKSEKGVRIMIKDRPKTEDVIPVAVLKKAPAQAAYGYTERHLGPRAEIGNKGGSLYNRLRATPPPRSGATSCTWAWLLPQRSGCPDSYRPHRIGTSGYRLGYRLPPPSPPW